MIDLLQNFTSGLPDLLQWVGVILAAAIPFVESHFGAVIGVLSGINPAIAIAAAIVGNILSMLIFVFSADGVRSKVRSGREPKPETPRRQRLRESFDKYGVAGSVHFSAKQIRANRLGATARYRNAHYADPALIPVMDQLPDEPPSAPRLVAARRTAAGAVAFDWQPGEIKPASWALYRVDGAVARLVATGRDATVEDPAPPAGATYCLSGLDRSGNEGIVSAPLTVSS